MTSMILYFFFYQVSDGEKESAITMIPVNVYSLLLTHVQNTGAILAYKSSVVISPSNLTFITNADDPSLEITFKVSINLFMLHNLIMYWTCLYKYYHLIVMVIVYLPGYKTSKIWSTKINWWRTSTR